ncbi:MAG: hypothetical protein KF726_10515 [Anaerolineae bacterium]|nr:hypothetical protein [Anaerolineae bacterium]
MRLISPIAIDEIFQASGVYLYYRDEQLLDITEAWSIHRTPQGCTVTRIERNAPAFGALVLVETRQPEGATDIEQIEVHWWNQTPGAVGVAAASYTLQNGVIDCLRWVDGSELVRESILTPPTLVVSPLMRVFLGSVLPKVADKGEAMVFVPWIHDPMDADRLLTVDLERRSASALSREVIEVEGEEFSTTCYSYYSRTDDDDARFWVADSGVLARYAWNGWDVRLAEYRTEEVGAEEDEAPYPLASSAVFYG